MRRISGPKQLARRNFARMGEWRRCGLGQLNANYPATQISLSLPAAGAVVSETSGVANITGGGWENLFLPGNVGARGQANDRFFCELAAHASWEAVIEDILRSDQYFNAGSAA